MRDGGGARVPAGHSQWGARPSWDALFFSVVLLTPSGSFSFPRVSLSKDFPFLLRGTYFLVCLFPWIHLPFPGVCASGIPSLGCHQGQKRVPVGCATLTSG